MSYNTPLANKSHLPKSQSINHTWTSKNDRKIFVFLMSVIYCILVDVVIIMTQCGCLMYPNKNRLYIPKIFTLFIQTKNFFFPQQIYTIISERHFSLYINCFLVPNYFLIKNLFKKKNDMRPRFRYVCFNVFWYIHTYWTSPYD